MKLILLIQLWWLTLVNTKSIYPGPTVLTGNQIFEDEVIIDNGGGLVLNDGSEYIFNGGYHGGKQCSIDINAAKGLPFTLTTSSDAKLFENGCVFKIRNANTGAKTIQSINFSPIEFKNTNKFILELGHTNSDASSRLILGSPEIVNSGEISYISTGVEIGDSNNEGNLLKLVGQQVL